MKEEELHYIIEQQDYENKQRIWKKVVESLSKTYPQFSNQEKDIDKGCKSNCDKQKTTE